MKRKEMMKQTMAFTLALSMLGGLACTVSASEPEKKDTWLSDEMVTTLMPDQRAVCSLIIRIVQPFSG